MNDGYSVTFDGITKTLGSAVMKLESDMKTQIEKGGDTTVDLLRLQALVQKWTITSELQSVIFHSLGGTLKFILERMV